MADFEDNWTRIKYRVIGFLDAVGGTSSYPPPAIASAIPLLHRIDQPQRELVLVRVAQPVSPESRESVSQP